MKIVSKPRRPRAQRPKPPWRTLFLRAGTIAENDGATWILCTDSDFAGSWKWWERTSITKEQS